MTLIDVFKHLPGQHSQQTHAGSYGSEISSLKRKLRKEMGAASDNKITIKAAKMLSVEKNKVLPKDQKITFRDILKTLTPSDNVIGEPTWDKQGNLGKVK